MARERSGFGKDLLASSLGQAVELEADARSSDMCRLDALLQSVLLGALEGKKIVTTGVDSARLLQVDTATNEFIVDRFSLERLQGKGAWFVPDTLRLRTGFLNGPHYALHEPRFAMTLATDEQARVSPTSSADHLVSWALLQPVFSAVMQPLFLRGAGADGKNAEGIRAGFLETLPVLDAVSASGDYAMQPLEPGSGWAALQAGERIERRKAYIRGLAASIRPDAAQRLRVLLVRPLVEHYYARAKNGPPTHRQVLKKDLQPVLVAFFGGDWFDFLAYIGESPSPEEQIHTTLPEPKLLISTSDRIGDAAKKLNLPDATVAKVVSGFWNNQGTKSPVEVRVELMKRYWAEFTRLHDIQRPGMPPLWGLVSDGEHVAPVKEGAEGPYLPGLYRKILPRELDDEIRRLWGRAVLPSKPAVSVDCPFPHGHLAEAFGAALDFWNNCSLTAWFLCEGPYSRTDMAGLEHHQRRALQVLREVGCGVDPRLFADLIEAERKLGPPQEITRSATRTKTDFGELTISIGGGQRRDGFERLRDVIRVHRDNWSASFIDHYLMANAERGIGQFAERYSKEVALKGSQPTLKATAKAARKPADNWFNGDLSLLYAAIGEKCPEVCTYVSTIPYDVQSLVTHIYTRLGGRFPLQSAEFDESRREWALQKLASRCLDYYYFVAMNHREPTLEEFGSDDFSEAAKELNWNMPSGWTRYIEVCRDAGARRRN